MYCVGYKWAGILCSSDIGFAHIEHALISNGELSVQVINTRLFYCCYNSAPGLSIDNYSNFSGQDRKSFECLFCQ